MTYPEALAYIASLEPRGWRLGLDRMGEFVRRAGLTAAIDGTERKYIHVAGTNGKGSVTAFLQSLLVEDGSKAGAFFSPYVVDPRERVQIGREMIPQDQFAEFAVELRLISEAMDSTDFAGVTEFEFKTALGFLAWRRSGTDWVALETGLGGRLDATNVVTPAATVIVSIGLDHQAILGDTIELIAFEKAGIIKPGIPLILGAVPEGAAQVIREVAAENGSRVWQFGSEIMWDAARKAVITPDATFEGLEPSLKGVWQPHNLSLAIAALVAAKFHLTSSVVKAGAANAYAPGRYEKKVWRGRTVILDGAHNSDSSAALVRTFEADLGPNARVILLTNMLLGHDPAAFYAPLASIADSAVIAPVEFHRRRDPAETVAVLAALGVHAEAAGSVEEALEKCVQLSEPGVPILVTGSFYLVGEVVRAMGLG